MPRKHHYRHDINSHSQTAAFILISQSPHVLVVPRYAAEDGHAI